MPRLVAFLRAINVGGHVVKMDALRSHFCALGFDGCETFIASGNVVFSTRAGNLAALEKKIEKRLIDSLGYEVKTFLRTGAEVAAVAAYKPFKASVVEKARALSVGFLAEPLSAAGKKALLAIDNGNDFFHVNGREVYWLAQSGQGESELNNVKIEKLLGARVTFRGMKTMSKLTAKYGFAED